MKRLSAANGAGGGRGGGKVEGGGSPVGSIGRRAGAGGVAGAPPSSFKGKTAPSTDLTPEASTSISTKKDAAPPSSSIPIASDVVVPESQPSLPPTSSSNHQPEPDQTSPDLEQEPEHEQEGSERRATKVEGSPEVVNSTSTLERGDARAEGKKVLGDAQEDGEGEMEGEVEGEIPDEE